MTEEMEVGIDSAPTVRFEEVYKSFNSKAVLSGITFDAPAMSTTCIIGPSGSGKTTLLRCVNRLDTPDSGHIYLGDVDVSAPGIPLEQVRAKIGMVFQSFNLFPHLSAADNVSLAPRVVRGLSAEEATEKALALLKRVGLLEFAAAKPTQLSGGQQQRVAIARALAMDPRLILFDEPTSALDPELVQEVLEVMGELSREKITMIVATHEMRFARQIAGLVVFMDNGVVVEQGPPAEIFEHPKSPRLINFLGQVGVL